MPPVREYQALQALQACWHLCALAGATGLATLLFDLLSSDEAQQRHNVFDIALLDSRLQLAVDWLEAAGTHTAGKCPPTFPLGFFGASTGEAVATTGRLLVLALSCGWLPAGLHGIDNRFEALHRL